MFNSVFDFFTSYCFRCREGTKLKAYFTMENQNKNKVIASAASKKMLCFVFVNVVGYNRTKTAKYNSKEPKIYRIITKI